MTNQERPIRIFWVENDEDYRQIVGDELAWHGFTVRSFGDGESLLRSLDAAVDADVIVIAWRLPNISGIDLLTQLRRQGVNLPVMFLTGYGQVDNERQAFARGAIDFMDKTRGVEILARRLKLVANHPPGKPEADACVVCGKLLLRPIDCRAYWNEIDVCLTSTEYKIVRLLVSNIGHFQTYRDIYNLQYYQGFVAGQRGKGHQTNIRSTIKRIRRKFCALDPTFAEIENSGGIGYRWRNRLQ